MNNRRNPNQRKRRRKPPVNPIKLRMRRIKAVGMVLIICIIALMGRMWYLQEVYGDDYSIIVAAQQARRDIERTTDTQAARRGGFLDRNMQPLTETQQVFTVYLNVESLHNRHLRNSTVTEDIREEVINAISVSLNMPRWNIQEMLNYDTSTGELLVQEGRRRRVLRHEVPAEIAIPLSEMFAEIGREETSLRWYQDPFFAPQVIGFTRGGYSWGLEGFYSEELAGEQGRRTWVQGDTEIIPVRDGYTLVTTIDSDIQRLSQYHMNRALLAHPSRFAAMVVMDPFTGEILSMAQAPTFSLADPFNPDYFTAPDLVEIWNDLTYGERTTEVMSLWRNYHTSRSSEPGSVFKPFVMAAAIEEGVIIPGQYFTCEGTRVIFEMPVSCHNRYYGCGRISLRTALYRSCNLAMVTINSNLGRDIFYRYRGYFGFGERTGIDLPGEECVSHHTVMYPWGRLHAVEMATSSMGQGFNATTMQLINGYAALINGGNLLRPFIVSQVVDANGNVVHENQPSTVVRRVISPETSDFIRTEMRFVVNNRDVSTLNPTGRQSYIAGHTIGGKTGTAQQGVRANRDHNLTYVAFLPVENPQFLVLMTLDHIEDDTRFAGDTVAPIMRDFFLDLIQLRNIQPTGATDNLAQELFGTPMPDFSGQRLTDAINAAPNLENGGFHVSGGGTIISHTWPAPGNPMPESSPVIFYMDPQTRIPDRMVTVPDVVSVTTDVASQILIESGLQVIIATGSTPTNDETDFQPRTAMPEPLPYDEYAPPPPPPAPSTVRHQFPAANSEIEQGTRVIIRTW
ncbi:MAG: penicillin-binding transpeptidase domain-containing protein [Defluviitaleaceae bacterium]|nr:penicillin-binding transpeptidase domain-containing protein [Defluviitaleaceae bacterium]